jgi:hypothetical protein
MKAAKKILRLRSGQRGALELANNSTQLAVNGNGETKN